MAKTILRKTSSKAAVKVSGTGVTETITLATDLLHSTEEVSGTPTVNILGMTWCGDPASKVSVTRNNVVVAAFSCENAGQIDFEDTEYVDTQQNTYDLVVTTTGQAMIWINLRKASGYASKLETARFGSYDNENAVGS